MLEARITKAAVVYNNKMETTLVAVAEYYDDAVNIKVNYDWNEIDQEGFIEDLREKLAQDFDLPVYRVDVQADKILEKMRFADLKSTGLIQ